MDVTTMSVPNKDVLKEANALIDYVEQARGVGEDEIYEVSFDIEDWQNFAADVIEMVKRAKEVEK